MPMEAPEVNTCESCGQKIKESASVTDGRGLYWHADHAPEYVKSYITEPKPIGDESTTPTLCVGYPVEGGVHLLRRYRDRAGGGTEFNLVEALDNNNVDELIKELKKYKEESPSYIGDQ